MDTGIVTRCAQTGWPGGGSLAGLLVAAWSLFGAAAGVSAASGSEMLLVTQFQSQHLAYVDPVAGLVARVEVGRAPYDLAIGPDAQAYVATAEGVAVVDLHARRRSAMIPYRNVPEGPRRGEYRVGGMGIAVSPDGAWVAVGVHHGRRDGRLELISTTTRQVTASVAVGVRPFQVLFSHDGGEVYSIDHDSYSVTAVDVTTHARRRYDVAALGLGAFDKPHYAALDAHGRLLLPIQGRTLVVLDPRSGEYHQRSLSADTHQHGVALSSDGATLFVVGTGPAGGAASPPRLSQIDLVSGGERQIPLPGEHEQIVLSADGATAYLSGGHSYSGGWDGIRIIDLASGASRTLAVPAQPLGLKLWRDVDT